MAQLDTTQTWSTGDTVTAAKLNQMITGATVRSEIISNQVEQTAAANSSDMVVIESGGSLYKLSVGTLSQSPVWDANKIQSKAVASTAPTDGQVLIWDNANTQWSPSDVSASTLAANSVGASELADNAVDTAAIVDGAVSAAKLGSSVSTVPTGCISMWYTGAAPTGWLICDGSTFDASTYADLNTLLGGNTLPNLKGRVPVGVDSSQTEFDTLGETGGAKTHTLTESELPAHNHEIRSSNWQTGGGSGGMGNSTDQQHWGYTEDTGGGGAHNNLQPYIAINFIIKT